jgi:DNA-binding response OmpR family regulator
MPKILIAEDEQDILDLIIFTLKFGGYEVIPTSNGEEALKMTREHLPDLVLLDVRMPLLSGYQVCSEIKSDVVTQHIPVIFLSAKGQEAEIKIGYEKGAIDYILKPFAPDQLLNRLQDILTTLAAEQEI